MQSIAAGTPLLAAQSLCLTRGGRDLFHDLSFAVHAGQLWQIEGANGAGKTSLLAAGTRVLVTRALTVDVSDAKLDLSDNSAIVEYNGATVLPAIQSWIFSGRNGGAWNGYGIASSAAAPAPILRGIGIL